MGSGQLKDSSKVEADNRNTNVMASRFLNSEQYERLKTN